MEEFNRRNGYGSDSGSSYGPRTRDLACHGKLIGGKEADAFRRSALLLMGGFDKLTINLAGVRTVDCGGLGSLAAVLAWVHKQGSRCESPTPTRSSCA